MTAHDSFALYWDGLASYNDILDAAEKASSVTVAAAYFELSMAEIKSGTVRSWVPALAVIAARQLGRELKVLPYYEHWLLHRDKMSVYDWWGPMISGVPRDDLFALSKRGKQTQESLDSEVNQLLPALGDCSHTTVLDFGCAGGVWSFALARRGIRVFGTDRNSDAIKAAALAAHSFDLASLATFQVDDATRSALETGSFAKAICIGVTPHVVGHDDIGRLISELDRITRQGSGHERRVILGFNRWLPSRMQAVTDVLALPCISCRDQFSLLLEFEAVRWLGPADVDLMKEKFSSVSVLMDYHITAWGRRVDFLLT